MADPHATAKRDPTADELFETIARYPDLDDKLTIALGNYRRVQDERDLARAQLSDIRRQAEELRGRGDWPVAKVVAERDALAAELASVRAQLDETREALRLVEAWIRRGEGSEADAVEAMDAALAAPDTLPCGHPLTAVVSAGEGTSYCGACAARPNAHTATNLPAEERQP